VILRLPLSIKSHDAKGAADLIVSFKSRGTEDIYDGTNSKAARKTLPSQLHRRAGIVLDQLNGAVSLQTLSLPGLRLERLYGDRKGQHSVRINDQYRVCFRWTDDGPEDVEITDYH
jgi:proteic killer suppression protein